MKWTVDSGDILGYWTCASVATSTGVGSQWNASGNDIYNGNTGNVTIGSGAWMKTLQFNSGSGPRIYAINDSQAGNVLTLHSGKGSVLGQGTGLVKVIGNLFINNPAGGALGLYMFYNQISSSGSDTLILQGENSDVPNKVVSIGLINKANLVVTGNITANQIIATGGGSSYPVVFRTIPSAGSTCTNGCNAASGYCIIAFDGGSGTSASCRTNSVQITDCLCYKF